MKIIKISFRVLAILAALLLAGCSKGISLEEYYKTNSQLQTEQAKEIELVNENASLKEQIAGLKTENQEAQSKITSLTNENIDLKQQLKPTSSPSLPAEGDHVLTVPLKQETPISSVTLKVLQNDGQIIKIGFDYFDSGGKPFTFSLTFPP
ncbi:MAG: hypothetical protein A2Z28_07130 [Chloroflexi bacterium RBG_16_51_9]|nr:MAG: hypothetical protein A2Z28_07130 [Chloroflexi bacterium RBG_16_51_9]